MRGNTAFDSSALIEYLMGTKASELVKEYFKTLRPAAEEATNCSLITMSEIFYILCRFRGTSFAEDKIRDMPESQVLEV